MKHTLIILGLFIALAGCSKTAKNQPVEEVTAVDSTAVVTMVGVAQLKNVTIDDAYCSKKNETVRIPTSKEVKAMFKQMFSSEELTNYKDASLRIIDTLYLSDKTKLLVVSREMDGAFFTWLTQFDTKDKLLFCQLVFKNDLDSELYHTISTQIKDSTITLSHLKAEEVYHNDGTMRDLVETKTLTHYVFTAQEEIHYLENNTDLGRVDFGEHPTQFVTEPVSKNDIYDVKSTVLILPPFPEKTFEDENSEEAEAYFAMADDFGWYTAETSQHFQETGVKTETTHDKRYVRFQLDNGKQVIVDTKRNDAWGALLYKKGKLPIKIDIVTNDLETAKKYLKH
ncbi:MAG: hypothetical protein LBN93_05010 [Candidatus Symbiothrix sp.]|jgi:hypothetical protein|nr:hypothetical protein [Candidatus Symbiothrix sp.]